MDKKQKKLPPVQKGSKVTIEIDGLGHSGVVGGLDAEAVNGGSVDNGKADVVAAVLDSVVEFGSLGGGKAFGIVHVGNGAVENNGGSHNGTCEGASSGFVDACNVLESVGGCFAFEGQHGVDAFFFELCGLVYPEALGVEGANACAGIFLETGQEARRVGWPLFYYSP